MSTETLSLDLYKANVELQLRITRLLQESGHQWLEAVQRASAENIAETTAEIEGLMRAGNWQALVTLPSESFWRLFQKRTGDMQLVNQIALKNQTSFASGLQQPAEAALTRVFTAQIAGQDGLGGSAVGVHQQHRTRPGQGESESRRSDTGRVARRRQHHDGHHSARFTTTSRPAAASRATSSLSASATITSSDVLPSARLAGATAMVAR